MTEADLLRRYGSDRSESAFRELVARHLDLVYSVALRHVRSPDLAADVAQSVFIDLAQHAGRIKSGTPLVAWLHLVARRTAIDVVRADARRHAREAEAARLAAAESADPHAMSPTSNWSAIEPLLDEAVESLNPTDRTAILLRFFENKSLREIGVVLGTSDDAAQKRVARALENLRVFLFRRGATVTAAGLAMNLSAQAVQPAPATLGSCISAAAFSKDSAAVALYPPAKALAMTTPQKIIVASTLMAAIGTGIYEAVVISRQNATLEQQAESHQRALRLLRNERDETARKLAATAEQLAAAQAKAVAVASADPAVEQALDAWLQNVVRLKQELDQRESLQIPELQFLSAKDWLDATKETNLESDFNVRRALSHLRQCGKNHFTRQLFTALSRYLAATNHRRPSDLADLAPYFETAVDPAILSRYGVFTVEELGPDWIPFKGMKTRDGRNVEWAIREKQSVDPYIDTVYGASEGGFGFGFTSTYEKEIDAAVASFRSAHRDQHPTQPSQLAPYLKAAIDPAFVQHRLSSQHRAPAQ